MFLTQALTPIHILLVYLVAKLLPLKRPPPAQASPRKRLEASLPTQPNGRARLLVPWRSIHPAAEEPSTSPPVEPAPRPARLLPPGRPPPPSSLIESNSASGENFDYHLDPARHAA